MKCESKSVFSVDSIVISRLNGLVCFACQSVLIGSLLQSLRVCLSLLSIELLLQVAGCSPVVASLGIVLAHTFPSGTLTAKRGTVQGTQEST
jgi:hypothetical protein